MGSRTPLKDDRARQLSRRSVARLRDAGESRRTIVVALIANALIALAKLAGGLLSGSTAMLAEAAHSLADTTNQVFLVTSLRLGAREPTPERPFGHGQQRFLWTFLAAVGMFVAGALFAIGYGTYELLAGEAEDGGYLIAYVVLGISLLAEGSSWARALTQTRREAAAQDRSLRRHIRESRDPSVKMILFEDTAALVGIVVAAAGVALHQVTGDAFWDPAASIAVGVLLIGVAVGMGRDASHLLTGASATAEERETIEGAIESFGEVVEVRELLTLVLGPNAVMVAARLDFEDGLDAARVERVSRDIDDRVRAAVPDVTEVFLDPTGA